MVGHVMQGHVDSERLTCRFDVEEMGAGAIARWCSDPMGRASELAGISGCAPKHINTKPAAQQALLDQIERVLHPERVPQFKEVPTFAEWFKGRF